MYSVQSTECIRDHFSERLMRTSGVSSLYFVRISVFSL